MEFAAIAPYLKDPLVLVGFMLFAESTIEYFDAVRSYCANDVPDRGALGAVLAAERLTMRLLAAHGAELDGLASQVEQRSEALQ